MDGHPGDTKPSEKPVKQPEEPAKQPEEKESPPSDHGQPPVTPQIDDPKAVHIDGKFAWEISRDFPYLSFRSQGCGCYVHFNVEYKLCLCMSSLSQVNRLSRKMEPLVIKAIKLLQILISSKLQNNHLYWHATCTYSKTLYKGLQLNAFYMCKCCATICSLQF